MGGTKELGAEGAPKPPALVREGDSVTHAGSP